MRNNKIKIYSCFDCPFRQVDYDDFAVGDDTVEICGLALFLNTETSILCTHDTKMGDDEKEEIYIAECLSYPPLWCPIKGLKNEELTVKFKRSKKVKPNFYSKDGILRGMDVGDWVFTKKGEVIKITHHDMPDLKGEDIKRFATLEEIKIKNNETTK